LLLNRVLFALGLALAASGWLSPPLALTAGIVLGLAFANPFPVASRKLSKWLLQASVVGLGFGMDLHQVVHAGRSGFLYTFLGITFALLAGTLLGRLLRVESKASYLISTGTAICGGSAIAAVAPITEANEEQIAVSLGTVFVLNSIALLIFPLIGHFLQLSQQQFGLWAALAIHDTSSVVGATAKFGQEALAVGTTVKLARALWIVPLALVTAAFRHSKAKVQWPWFIGFFCLAAVANTYVVQGAFAYALLYQAGRLGLTVTLFLIGSGISLATLRKVGARPLVQGVLLWALVATTSLWLILHHVIHL
jgi:uncharacterized integral membrane protein (TIGR00698 family)